jgi:hypothetical protein
MAITAAVITKNVCMSRHWKSELVAYGIHLQLSPGILHLIPLKPDRSVGCRVWPTPVQHHVQTSKSRNYQTVH